MAQRSTLEGLLLQHRLVLVTPEELVLLHLQLMDLVEGEVLELLDLMEHLVQVVTEELVFKTQ
jgi:hypothetical protein